MTVAGNNPARLVVVLSGRGRNLEAIMAAIDDGRLQARIALVISDKPQARGLRMAREAGLPWAVLEAAGYSERAAYDDALATRIAGEQPDWVVLAGFMRILGSAFVKRFAGRLVNIHPSLLPRYKGLHTHERVLANNDTRHGASVHFVTDTLDAGPVIRQGSIAVQPDDTADSLASRLMVRVEQRLYPAALADLISARVAWQNGEVWREGAPQEGPLHEDYDFQTPR